MFNIISLPEEKQNILKKIRIINQKFELPDLFNCLKH